jgi:hypothetical protein
MLLRSFDPSSPGIEGRNHHDVNGPGEHWPAPDRASSRSLPAFVESEKANSCTDSAGPQGAAGAADAARRKGDRGDADTDGATIVVVCRAPAA